MEITVELTAPEQHPTSAMPKALRTFWYSSGGDDLRKLINYSGCPNTGCQHTLRIWGKRVDVLAWLDLFEESYPGVEKEIAMVKREIHKSFVQTGAGSTKPARIKLANITRQVGYNGELITRRWFWAPFWEERG